MKKLLTLFVAGCLFIPAGFSAPASVAPITPVSISPAVETPVVARPSTRIDANAVRIPIGKTGKSITLKELSTIKMDELETLTGKKMSFFERIAFHKTQKKLSKGIDKDGYVTNNKLNKALSHKEGGSGFHLGGFALGFLIGLIGVLIAYLIDDDLKRNRVKWAWIGCAVAVVLYLGLFVGILF